MTGRVADQPIEGKEAALDSGTKDGESLGDRVSYRRPISNICPAEGGRVKSMQHRRPNQLGKPPSVDWTDSVGTLYFCLSVCLSACVDHHRCALSLTPSVSASVCFFVSLHLSQCTCSSALLYVSSIVSPRLPFSQYLPVPMDDCVTPSPSLVAVSAIDEPTHAQDICARIDRQTCQNKAYATRTKQLSHPPIPTPTPASCLPSSAVPSPSQDYVVTPDATIGGHGTGSYVASSSTTMNSYQHRRLSLSATVYCHTGCAHWNRVG